MNPYQNTAKKIGSVTVIGGGIAGVQAALDVAESGFKVHVVEEKPSIGGVMAQLDKTFPTNDCSACMMGPKLAELVNHPHIEILAYTDLLQIEGDPGDFTVTLKKKARAVDPERCVGCGICAEKCPVDVSDAFNLNLNKRKAVYLPYPQAVPLVYTIDKRYCRHFTKGKCRICEQFCEHNAIIFDQEDEIIQLETGAVILAGGFEPFDAGSKGEYGYGRWPNVITSLEYERILSASGPFQGRIQRVSDGKKPRRIAWIQCVGSRDSHMGREYCSSVCCMYATKQATITKEHDPSVETTIFCIDVRAHGKGFDRFYERSKSEKNVRYVRSMISRIVPNPEDDTLQITYAAPGNQLLEATYDMVVLSIGLGPGRSIKQLAKQIGFQLNTHEFCLSDSLNSEITSKEGLYVCGVMQEPKDIPEAVQQGSSAAAHAMSLLADAKGSLISSHAEITERDVTGEEPRIGVFVCHCGINIAGIVDVEAVTDYARSLPDVVVATHCMFACSADQQVEIKKTITEQGLNRVVVASCSPRTHEPIFRDTLRQAGLNPYLFELANIREHDSWVHQTDPEAATQKAKDLVAMSTSRARLLKPLSDTMFPVVQTALVIGGGLAGLTSALTLAEQGYETVVVEQSTELGGNARTLHYTEEGTNPAEYVQKLIQSVEREPLITVYTEAELTAVTGSCGNFMSTVQVRRETKDISHGVVLVATGGEEYKPSEYYYGKHPGVITQKEFETLLVSQTERAKQLNHVVMIQCVGSREPEHLYCSKVCCTAAIKNSIKLKELNPGADVSILYRDIRTFGFKENYYLQSRRQGVRFYRFKREQKPEVTFQDDRFTVSVLDDYLQTPVQLTADLLVLSAAIRPREESKGLADIIRLPLDEDGFFMEAHPKLRPLDFSKAGVYLCGLAQGPKFAKEAITQARGAVSRAAKVLSKQMIVAEGMITHVDPNLCRACGECENTCVFEAVKVQEVGNGRKTAVVTQSLCTGCGACNAACPTCAASLAHFQDDQINVMIATGFRRVKSQGFE
jgi:heterodisulfide reductase subunit A